MSNYRYAKLYYGPACRNDVALHPLWDCPSGGNVGNVGVAAGTRVYVNQVDIRYLKGAGVSDRVQLLLMDVTNPTVSIPVLTIETVIKSASENFTLFKKGGSGLVIEPGFELRVNLPDADPDQIQPSGGTADVFFYGAMEDI